MLKTLKLLLPALIPSWNFFDVIAPSPRIEITLLSNALEHPRTWREFRPRPVYVSITTMLRRLFWNPWWNESLFLMSCAERLMDAPTDHTLQQIVKRIQIDMSQGAQGYSQFRLVLLSRQGTKIKKKVTYLSPVFPLSEGDR